MVRLRSHVVKAGSHIPGRTVNIGKGHVDGNASGMVGSLPGVGNKLRIWQRLPQPPLGFNGTKAIENPQPTADPTRQNRRTGQSRGGGGMQQAERTAVNRATRQIIDGGIPQIEIDIETRGCDLSQKHSKPRRQRTTMGMGGKRDADYHEPRLPGTPSRPAWAALRQSGCP